MFAIAGATGHTGGVAAKLLLGQGKKVRVLVRSEEKAAPWRQAGAEVAVGELGDEAFLGGALRGAEGAFLLLPPPNPMPDSADAFYAFQRTLAQAIGAAVKASGVPHVVFLSSFGAQHAEGNGPIKGLYHAEKALEASGAKLTSLRASAFMENLGGMIPVARELGVLPAFFPPSLKTPMVATRDLGDGVSQLLLEVPAANQVFNLTGPEDYSAEDVAALLGRFLGRQVHVAPVPLEEAAGALAQGGMPPVLAGIYAEMFQGAAKGLVAPEAGQEVMRAITPLKQVLGELVRG